MRLSKCHKQWICILFALTIVLSGISTGISQGNVFLACQNIPAEAQLTALQENEDISYANKPSNEEHSTQKYQVTHTSFAKEDCRIEGESAGTLRKVNSVREEKRGNRGKSGVVCTEPVRQHSKCLKSVQDQYIYRTKSIETINQLIIFYIHQKDGAKGTGLFF